MSSKQIDLLQSLSTDTVQIQALNIDYYINKYNLKHFYISLYKMSISTYYRLLIPEVFKGYDKILYLDTDTLILGNIQELLTFQFVSNDTVLGVIRMLNSKRHFKHFCAGVLLFNLKNCNSLTNECFSYLKNIPITKTLDEYVLNKIVSKLEILPSNWHVLIKTVKDTYPDDTKLFHYVSRDKKNWPLVGAYKYWYEYAKKSEILKIELN